MTLFGFTLLGLTLCSAPARAAVLDLTAPPDRWTTAAAPGTQITISPEPGIALTASIASAAGGEEPYPRLQRRWDPPQDLSAYTRIRLRLRAACPGETTRRLAVVFYDEETRQEALPGRPMTQQMITRVIPTGEWVEFDDWVTGIRRNRVREMDLYLYRDSEGALSQKWELARLELEGAGERTEIFDGVVYPPGTLSSGGVGAGGASPGVAPSGAPVSPSAGTVAANDSLTLALTSMGAIASVSVGGTLLGQDQGRATGLLARDVESGDPPVMLGGQVSRRGADLVQSGRSDRVGLSVDAVYKSAGGYIEVSGRVADLRGKDRAITLYLVLPVVPGEWTWWDNVATSRTASTNRAGPGGGSSASDRTGPAGSTTEGELSSLESGLEFGLGGRHSKYPIGAISLTAKGGLTLGVRMDEPVVHRIGYDPALHVFYIAADFGLVPEQTANGGSLSQAPFRFLIYRHDPAWGFRSALQRYYDFFPDFFTNRISRPGGWYAWGDLRDTRDPVRSGFGLHWGPAESAISWDNANGVFALLYIEPEFYQETMGDLDRRPTVAEGVARLKQIASGDPAGLAAYRKLAYASSYAPSEWIRRHGLDSALVRVSAATLASVGEGRDGQPVGIAGQYPWMGESHWGVLFPCDLSNGIPGGKGRYNREVYIQPSLSSVGRYDGIGLDSFGGYGQSGRANYRRELFKYAGTPLTFSALDHRPVLAMPWSTIEWLRDLARDAHSHGRILMANCSREVTPGWLTFAAPYLDVFGSEAVGFADPDFIRAIARNKLCTDLPFKAGAGADLTRGLLWDIFPGLGYDTTTMIRYAQTFRDLAAARWEPLTHATVDPPEVRIERFGNTFVLYNPTAAPVEARVSLDLRALGLEGAGVPGTMVVTVGAGGTEVRRGR